MFGKAFFCAAVLAAIAVPAGAATRHAYDAYIVPGALISPGAYRNSACQAALAYVSDIAERRYDRIGKLFADDATYLGPNVEPIHGAPAIGSFYTRFLSRPRPPGATAHKDKRTVASLLTFGQRDCYVELTGVNNAAMKTPAALDHFSTDAAGKVTLLYIYFRPKVAEAMEAAAASALADK